MNTPIYEQETIVRFYRDEDRATVYTSDITMMNKLDKMVATSGDWYLVGSHNFKDGTIADKTYECPKQMISFRSKMVERKPLTEEQKEAKREQLRKNVRG
ncbi:MAG: hypothetical protein IIZ83_05785 [Oscillospiraceae bacterium]|nr:hypothetical protein [Oscillospiraceae bacterium]